MTQNKIYDGAHAAPVNAAAGKVIGGGEHYKSSKKIVQRHWEIPPNTIRVPATVKDLTGRRFGRFTVTGLLSKSRNKRGHLWLVRCDCSHYESRRSKSIVNPKNSADSCENCRQLSHIQREQEFLTTGKNRDNT